MGVHLLSCDGCKRQLDVTALRLGDEIACVCDAVLTVGQPQLVEPDECACGHCGGKVRPFHADESGAGECESCARPIRMASLPPVPKGRSCPSCGDDLRVHLVKGAALIECECCGGIWAQREAFSCLLREASDRAASDTQADRPSGGDRSDPSQDYLISCPACSTDMRRVNFRYSGRSSGITLDVCARHGIWFDHDELQLTLKFVEQVGGAFDPSAVDFGPRRGATGPYVTRRVARERVTEGGSDESLLWGFFDDGDYFGDFVGWALAALLD